MAGNACCSIVMYFSYELVTEVPTAARDFSFLHSVQAGCGAHCPKGTWGALSPGVKRPVHEADHSPSSSAEIKNGGVILPPPYMSSWRGPLLFKYRDNFTFCISATIYR
jgi:hypothetical protein